MIPTYVATPDIPARSKRAATNAHVNCEHVSCCRDRLKRSICPAPPRIQCAGLARDTVIAMRRSQMPDSPTAWVGLFMFLGYSVGMGAMGAGCILDFRGRRITLAKRLMRNGARIALFTMCIGGIAVAALQSDGLSWTSAVAFVLMVAGWEVVARFLKKRNPL